MGHIRLSREADLVVVAPATADLMAKMAAGLADDLASTLLLASDKPVLVAPAMNPQMWAHPATRRNLARLTEDGVHVVGPNPGDMACGEVGSGRMAEPHEILAAIEALLAACGPPARRHAGDRHQRADPRAARPGPVTSPTTHRAGRATPSRARWPRPGPPSLWSPAPCRSRTRRAWRSCMWRPRSRCSRPLRCLPAEIAVCAAAVADWRPVEARKGKIKKREGAAPPAIELVENPDILRTLADRHARRPSLVVGFAAETGGLEAESAGEARAQGLRLDPRQRRVDRARACSAAGANRSPAPDRSRPRRGLAGARQAGAWRVGWRSGSPRHWSGTSSVPEVARADRAAAARCAICPCRPMPPTEPPASICWRRSTRARDAGAPGPRARADRHPPGAAGRLRGAGPPALGPRAAPWRDGPECAWHDRCRLSRRDRGDPDQSRHRIIRIERGARIAQLVVAPVVRAAWAERSGGRGRDGRGDGGSARPGRERRGDRVRGGKEGGVGGC